MAAPPGSTTVTTTTTPSVASVPMTTALKRPDTTENQAQFCRERGTTARMADGRMVALDCASYVSLDRASYESCLMVR